MVGGGVVSKVDPEAVPVTPAWRTAITDMFISTFWDSSDPAEIQAAKQQTFDLIQPFRELAPIPAGGQYLNEVTSISSIAHRWQI